MKNILCYGDSNAWGFIPAKATRYDKNIRWPAVAAKELGPEYTIIEDSISGRTSIYEDPCVHNRCGADNLGYSLLAHAPLDMVIVAIGGNDLKFTDSDGSTRGVAKIVDMIKNADVLFDAYAPIFPNDCKILLLGPVVFDPDIAVKRPGHELAEKAEESTKLSAKYKKVAEEKGIYFFDESKLGFPSPADCIHMEPDSHLRLGHAIAEKIKEIFDEK